MRHRVGARVVARGTAAVAVAAALVATGGLGPTTAPSAYADGGDPPAPHAAQTQAHARHQQRAGEVTRSAARKATKRARAAKRADDDAPLAVTIDQLSPSTMPGRGDVEVTGTVTNRDAATWSTIKVYPFLSDEPMTTEAELAAAATTDPDAFVGTRIVDDTHDDTIDALAPGETQEFTLSIPRGVLNQHSLATVGHGLTPGVYWFGVHALGQGPDGRDDLADGRARTFLPLVPQRTTARLPTSVVLPLRRPIDYDDDGSLADVTGWTQALSSGGRLRSLVDLGASSGTQHVTWLVDPAVVDAVRRLAAGNPKRSLAATVAAGQGDGEPTGSASPSAAASEDPATTPSPDPSAGPDSGTQAGGATGIDGEPKPVTGDRLAALAADTRAAATAAQDWLQRLTAAVRPGDELLVLPYGDTDVSAAARSGRRLYQVAWARSTAATILPGLGGVRVTSAVGSPAGYLSPDALDLLGADTTALVSDQMLPSTDTTTQAPTLVSTDGHALVVTSTAAASGGPGPDDPTATVAMRQRLLGEAALRVLGPDPQPLVVLLPHDWNPTRPSGFFAGLDVPWLDLAAVTDATTAATPVTVDPDTLHYPQWQAQDELDPANFDAAAKLIATGSALQSLLSRNNRIGGTVTDEALGTASYSARTRPDAARLQADRARAWIDERLAQVTVSAPTTVTLSSSSGRFATTLTNRLSQPVTVSLDASTDQRLRIEGPQTVDIPPGSQTTVLLTGHTEENGVHRVTLKITDKRGVALGSSTELSIRSAQVSGVIWLFIGLGGLLLFGAIGLRLFRRIRSARHPEVAARRRAAADPEDDPTRDREPAHPAGAR